MSAEMHKWPSPGHDLGIFFMPISRTTFLVDGFNLYHSVVDASDDMGGISTKWLNIRSLCESYLHLFGPDNQFHELHYFSALAKHMNQKDPNTVARHQAFIDCLEFTGAKIELASFKKKEIKCKKCNQMFFRQEEKETDVALAVKLIEVCWHNDCDTAVLLTGDTDIAPSVRFVQRCYPDKTIRFLFPYKRKNKLLANLAPGFKISKEQYSKHQFPNTVVLADGTSRTKPATW